MGAVRGLIDPLPTFKIGLRNGRSYAECVDCPGRRREFAAKLFWHGGSNLVHNGSNLAWRAVLPSLRNQKLGAEAGC